MSDSSSRDRHPLPTLVGTCTHMVSGNSDTRAHVHACTHTCTQTERLEIVLPGLLVENPPLFVESEPTHPLWQFDTQVLQL